MLKASCMGGEEGALLLGSEDDSPESFKDNPTPSPIASPRTKSVTIANSMKRTFNRMPHTVRCLGGLYFGPWFTSWFSLDVM